ncbi:putative di- and tricarboxylate transporter [Microbacterium sp. TS-1]|uniref:SLC13 family permease n=1 Tax=Microbacterium sp. TS-1 TaxID=1344956 RepID=UPI00038F50AF|nr:SLC13 family permease [Microbacterium sp. TS-1]GAD33590.1 putative di- and tricarboxylate transporter [Microbacterium sp. TS-1]
MDPIVATFLILAAAIIAFLSARVPLEVVAVGVALGLWATGVLTLPQAFAGFGDPTVLFIASLFIVATALETSGVTRMVGAVILARAGTRRGRILIWVGGIVAILTALISINGAVAALIPVAAVIARRSGLSPSQLMLPMAFIASSASLLTLTGTPVNVVVSELAAEAGRPFGFFEFALVGLPLVAATIAIVVLLGPRLLPHHGPDPAPEHHTEREAETLSLVPEAVRTGAVRTQRRSRLHRGSRRTLAVTAVMVALLATGAIPPAVAGLLAAGSLIVLRVVKLPDLYHGVSWTTLVLIAGMIPLSVAFLETGAADVVADALLAVVGQADPHLALIVVCVVVVVLGQFISNVATVLIVAPVATSIALTLDVSALPFLMALTVAGASSFLTPVATPVNLMVMAPGGYRFGDYWRLGLPLTVLFLLAAVVYVPLIWRF